MTKFISDLLGENPFSPPIFQGNMKYSNTLWAALLGAGLLLACGGANATSKTSASLTNLQFTSIDLTPNDGQFSPLTYTYSFLPDLFSQLRPRGSSESLVDWKIDNDLQGLGSQLSYRNSQTSSSTANVPGGLRSLHASGTMLDDNINSLSSSSSYSLLVSMPAHTTFEISGHIALSASSIGYRPQGWGHDASATARITMYYETSVGSSILQSATAGEIRPNQTVDEDFILPFYNFRDTTMNVLVDFYSATNSDIYAPVPEPSSYAMFGAGLLLLGVAARKRACV